MTQFDASTVVLSDPAPAVTAQLADVGRTVYADLSTAGDASMVLLRAVDAAAVAATGDRSFASWADVIATEEGFPLLGAGRRAPTYPALMWNGARMDAIAPSVRWAPLLAALAAARPDTGLDRVGRAVIAGKLVADRAAALLPTDPLAYPTLGTLAAAAAASLIGPSEGADLVAALDLAASLTVLAPDARRRAASGWHAGHAAASGWLAATVPAEVVTPMPGSVTHTFSAASGRPASPDAAAPATVDELLDRLR